jgi:hypothetical protein
VIKFSPPKFPASTSLANFGLGEWITVTTNVTLKGGGVLGTGRKPKADGRPASQPAVATIGDQSNAALFKTGLLGNTVVKLTARCYLKGLVE